MMKSFISFTLTFSIFLSAWLSPQAQQIVQPSAKQLSANGTNIRYWEQGRGVPVVFVHGAFSDHRIWEPQREAVAKRYRFIAIDQRYFGTAPWSDTEVQFSPTTHISDLAAFIRALNAGPVYLVARSYGASIALATAVQHPDLVRGLLLNEPQSSAILVDPSDQRIANEDRKGFAAIRAAAEAGHANEATKLFYEWVNDQPGGFDALPAASRAMFLDNARTIALQVSAPPTPTTCAQAAQLKVPVTITKGELTRAFFRVIAEATSRCVPGSKLITIKGARHGAPAQQSAAFNEVLLLAAGQSTNVNSPTEEMQLKKLKVNEVELAYVEVGKGETVVFVHGFAGDWRTWELLRPFISARYHYVSMSRRYHYPNRWTDDGKNYSITQHVEDVAAFIRALNVGKVHLVGNSGGGRIVGHVALKYPELVRSVVMGEPGLIAPISPEGIAAIAASQENNANVVAAMKAGDARKAMRLHYDAIAGEQGAWEKLPLEQQRQRLDNANTVIPTLTGERAIPVTCEKLAALSVPALVVRGEKSPAYFRYRDERLLSCLPKTTNVAVIPGAHHTWYAVNPEASAKAILSFLDDQMRQAQPVVDPPAKQLSVNGTTIRYWEQGRGVPVVFVHGAISDHRYWEPQRLAVAKKYRFIAIDRRYFGTAPWPDDGGQHSQATDVADLAAFIRQLKSGPVFLVGSSGGAVVSLVTSVQHPELVRGLFVNEGLLASIVTGPADQKVLSEFRAGSRRDAIRAAAKAGNMEEAAKLLIDSVNGQTGTFDAAPPWLKAMFVDNARTLLLDAPPPIPITCAQLGELKVPVAMTMGQLTNSGFKLLVEAAHRCIPRSQLITIPAARHSGPWQNPSAFNEALLRFLARRTRHGLSADSPSSRKGDAEQ